MKEFQVEPPLRGGCQCGAIRFEIDDLFDAGYCHCGICRRLSGAPAVAWANAPARSFRLTEGEPRGFASSERWVRYFCSICGGPVYQRGRPPSPDGSDLLSVFIPTLDHPEAVRPTVHIWWSARLPWCEPSDDLPRFEEGELTHPSKRRPWRTRGAG